MPKERPRPDPTRPLPLSAREYLTAAEVARMLRREVKTIYTMAAQRKIPHRRCGRELLFDAQEIDDWMREAAERR